ncbi:hypothetical protein AAFC00_001230 [Neodothiora populina]|uniref:Uncharacterized protein n=1 Tax=Neodothiora populina TaxID=2781224 RepID=A0ABR3PN75_9PEZI
MDLYSQNRLPGGYPADPPAWERFILGQQDNCQEPYRGSRRFTVEGIPSFESFQARHDGPHDRSVSGFSSGNCSTRSMSSSPEPSVFDMTDLRDDLPGSKRGSQASSMTANRARHGYGSFRGSPLLASPRNSPLNSPKRARRFKRESSRHRHQPRGSTSSFEDGVRRDKARFFAQQQQDQYRNHRTGKQSRYSAMPRREQFLNVPQQPYHQKRPSSLHPRSSMSLYHEWRQACDEQLREKSTMDFIPAPPIAACGRCQHLMLFDRTEHPPTCIHSLETLFRGATLDARVDPTTAPTTAATPVIFADDKMTYLRILKDERNRWHTDRFGACKAEAKPAIEYKAKHLFVLTNELFEREKKRLDDKAEMQAAGACTHYPTDTPAAQPNDDFFSGGAEPTAW